METETQERSQSERAGAGEVIHLLYPCPPQNASPEIAQTYAYGMMEFEQDMQRLCLQLGYRPVAHHIDLSGFAAVLGALPPDERVFYLCDGNEQDDGVCGLTPVLHREQQGRPMISAGSTFWRNTTSKSVMKRLFVAAGVPTASYRQVTRGESWPSFTGMRFPLFVKPDALYGALGITDSSVLPSEQEVQASLPVLLETYGSVLVEEFVQGREFTVFVLRDGEVFLMAERCFDSSLPPNRRFISYERSWIDLAAAYPYQAVSDSEERAQLGAVARSAFQAVGGDQYARIDLRQQEETGDFLVLEVNSMPGLSLDSSVGECARVCGKTMLEVIQRILK
jgi:D-alanine-D-alanine ligase